MVPPHKNSPDQRSGLSTLTTKPRGLLARLQSFNAVIRNWFRAKGRQLSGLAFLVSVQPRPFSVKMDDLPIDALDLGRIGCPTKQCAELVDAFVDVYAGLAHGELRRLDVCRVI